jgi:hypothetical protein
LRPGREEFGRNKTEKQGIIGGERGESKRIKGRQIESKLSDVLKKGRIINEMMSVTSKSELNGAVVFLGCRVIRWWRILI